jgi:hypothetical protein
MKAATTRYVNRQKPRIYTDIVVHSDVFSTPVKFIFRQFPTHIKINMTDDEYVVERIPDVEIDDDTVNIYPHGGVQHDRLVQMLIHRHAYSVCRETLEKELSDLKFETYSSITPEEWSLIQKENVSIVKFKAMVKD